MIPRKLTAVIDSVPVQLFLTQVLVAASALIVNVFAARALGPEARGELALFMQIAYVTNAVAVLGRHRSYLKLDTTDVLGLGASQKDVSFLSRGPILLSAIAAVIGAAMLGNGLLTGFVFAAGMFTLVYSGVQQKTMRASAIVTREAKPYFIATVTGQLLLLLGAFIMMALGITDVPEWLLLYGGAVMIPYLVLSIILRTRGNGERSSHVKLNQVRSLGMKLMPLSVAEIVGSRADRFLIPALASFTQLGIYTVVVTMTELVAWPVKNYTDSKVPQWSLKIRDSRFKISRELALISIMILVLSIVIGSALQIILVPLFGSGFEAGKELIWPLVLAAALHAWSQFGANLNLAAGFTVLVNIIPIAGMITSGVSYFFLIPALGALGAAWGLVIGYSVAIMISLIGILQIARANS